MSFVTLRAQNRVMVSSESDRVVEGVGAVVPPRRGREKGVWGVERACHTGQHRSLQSVCVTQEIGADLGSHVLSRCAAASV
jgi:hypothetical protein